MLSGLIRTVYYCGEGCKFIDRDMLPLFEAVSWPVVEPEEQERQDAVKSVRINMAARLRSMWSYGNRSPSADYG